METMLQECGLIDGVTATLIFPHPYFGLEYQEGWLQCINPDSGFYLCGLGQTYPYRQVDPMIGTVPISGGNILYGGSDLFHLFGRRAPFFAVVDEINWGDYQYI